MKNDYFNELANRLKESIEIRYLNDKLLIMAYQYIDMLTYDNFSDDEKNQVAILAENFLSNLRDIPDKMIKNGKKRS